VNPTERLLTPLSPNPPPPELSKEVVSGIPLPPGSRDRRESEPETLDLSIKKREPGYVSVSSSVPPHAFAIPPHSKGNYIILGICYVLCKVNQAYNEVPGCPSGYDAGLTN